MKGLCFVVMPQIRQREIADESRRCYHDDEVHSSHLQCPSAENRNFHRQGKGRKGGNENRHEPITLKKDVQASAGFTSHMPGQQYLAALSGDFKQDQASADGAGRCAKRSQIGLRWIVRRDGNQERIHSPYDRESGGIQNR